MKPQSRKRGDDKAARKAARRCDAIKAEFKDLLREVKRHRRTAFGGVNPRIEWADPRDDADALAISLGKQPAGTDWCELPKTEARAHLAIALQVDLCYTSTRVMEEQPAKAFADQFLKLDKPVAILTNTSESFGNTWPIQSGWTFRPIADGTTDTGLVLVGESAVAMLWLVSFD